MLMDSSLWTQLMVIVGEIALLLVLGIIIIALTMVAITFLSIKRGKFYLPRVLQAGFAFLDGVVRALCRLLGMEDRDLTAFFINLHNEINGPAFSRIPVVSRAIFLPQCLRSSTCPAELTPEGLLCHRCGKCEIGTSVVRLEEIGYRVYIVPGSTFVKRIIKKYRPKAIIGVGCLMEVKEGLEMADGYGLISMGVVNFRDGCVETLANWAEIMKIAALGAQERVAPAPVE
jgi:uncharacterized protein